MREDVKLPFPKDEDLIKHIHSRLRPLNVCGAEIRTKPKKNEVHICGTEYKINHWKHELDKWIDEYYQEKQSNNKMKKVYIPLEAMGKVIGREFCNIKRIRQSTGTNIRVRKSKSTIYIDSAHQNMKKAMFELRDLASSCMCEALNREYSCDKYDFVNSTDNCDFELTSVDCPHTKWKQTTSYYKIKKVEDSEEDDADDDNNGELNIDELKGLLSRVLEKIQKDEMHDGKVPKADLWCHFGHMYVSGVDEGDEREKSLNDFQNKFNKGKDGWKMSLDPAVKDMEIKSLEEELQKSCQVSVPHHIRYDLTYLTPLCLKVRVKFFLDLNGKFHIESAKEDIDIREDELSSTSTYLLCDDFYHRAKISIAIPFRSMDVRMTLRTVSSRKLKDEKVGKEHEEILKEYFKKITISDGNLVFPSEDLPEGFSLHFHRKCSRRSYTYTHGEEGFSITLSDEEEMDIIGDGNGVKKTDIHLHNDSWDKLLTSGYWKPEQIVNNLETFLDVLQAVQENISSPEE